MARERTGAVKWNGTAWVARIRLNDGRRIPVHLPAILSEAEAKREARKLSEEAKRGELVYDPDHKSTGAASETTEHYGERWLEAREAKGMPSVRVDRTYLRTHLFRMYGRRPLASLKNRGVTDQS